MKKRLFSILTALALCLSLLPTAALAAESDGLCEHHTEHTAECGYVEGETPCGFVCDLCSGKDTVTVLTDWEWVDDWEIIDPDSGNVLLPFASEDNVAYFEDVVGLMPVSILAGGEELTLGDWLCPYYPEDGAYEGKYIFETTLPEGYALSDGGSTLTLTVALGGPEGEPVAMLAVSMTEPPQADHTIGGSTVYAYELSTAAHLYWFANQINTTQQDISAVLTADITVNQNVLNASGGLNSGSFEAWTPIGTVDHNFRGKFDGQGHTISGLYLNNSNTSNVGLFGIVDSPASIYRVGVVDSYFAGNQNVGGLCGRALSDVRIESCYTTATVSGTSNVGTFCGYSNANINNCYSAGTVGDSYGKFTGNDGDVDFCYALSDTNSDGTNDSDLKYRTIDAFKSGEVTYGLTKNQATPSWRQTIGTQEFPQCTTDGAIVYLGKKDGAVYYHNHTDGEASCSYCSVPDFYNNEYLIDNKEELYWFADYVNKGYPAANAQVRNDIEVDNDWVPIGNETYPFTGTFSYPEGQKTISGIPANSSLFGVTGSEAEIARITVTSGSLCATSGGKIVDCHVSGSGMLVSGANSGTVSDSSASGGTLIANNSGTVKNSSAPGGTLVQTNTGTITDCHDEGSGATLCANNNAGGTVTDCYVSGAASTVLVGANSGTIQKSYAAGGAKLCTTNDSGGEIINCYATGTGSVILCGSNNGTIANCFAAGGSGTTVGSGGTITNCYALADGTASTIGGTTLTTTAPFAGGEVAYRLNQGTGTYPGGVWGQTIGTDIGTDKLPIFGGKAVYYKQNGSPEYHNHNGYCSICTITPTYANDQWQITNVDELYWYAQYINGTISGITDKTKNAILMNDITVNSNVLNADGTLSDAHTSFTEWTPIGISSSNYDGTFDGNHHTISGLYVNAPGTSYVGFFGYIIGGGTIKNLTIADSYFKGNNYVGGVCGDTSGAVSGCSYSGAVTGIECTGGICGQSQGTVSGCTNRGKVTGNNKFGGICGYAYNGTVSGCINYGAVNGSGYVGGICGYALYGEVSGCINYGAVNGTSSYVGGVCGVNSKTVIGCTNTGAVTGSSTSYYVGGVCGENKGTISGCYSIGTVTGTSSVGGVCGVNSGTVSNCYHNSEAYSGNAVGDNSGTVDSVLGKTTREFASGEVAYLLNGSRSVGTAEAPLVWYQNIDSGIPDAAPQFTGGTVYATTSTSPCQGYTNNSNGIKQHKYENYVCTWCGHQGIIPVIVSGITAKDKIYDGTTTATLDFSRVTLSGVVSGDTVTVNATGTFEDKDVGANKTVTIIGLTLTGDDAGKYRLADSGQQATATASITKKSVTAAVTVADKTYNGDTVATVTAAVNAGVVSGDTITIEGLTGTFEDANVGTNIPVTVNATNKSITGTGSGNYDVTIPTEATGTISKAALGASVTLDGWTYGDTPKGPVVTGNTENGEVTYLYKVWSASDETYSPTVPTEAGKYSVKATIAATANYQQDVVYDDFTIVPKVLTVTGLTATDRVYDGTTNVTLTGGELSGIVAGDEGRVTAAMPTTGTIANADAGNGKLVTYATIDLTGDKSENYALRRPMVTVNIEPLGVDEPTVTGTYTYDRTQKTVTLDGFESSYMTVTGNTGTNAGAYTATVTLDGNHKWNEGSDGSIQWTIAPKRVTATVTVTTRPYNGDTDATVSAVVTTSEGLINGDSITITGLTGTFVDDANVGDDKPVTVNAAGKSITGTDASNYDVTIPTEATGDILPKAIGIDWSNTTLTYNGMPQKPTATATGLVGEDACTITVSGEQTNAGDSYTAEATDLDNGNYQLPVEKNTTFSIARKEVTAAPKNVTITRGSAIPAFELTYTGLLGEDTLTPSADPAFTCYEKDGTTAVSTGTAAGTYTITWTNTDVFDGETNYRVVAATGTLTINNPSSSGGGSNTTTTTEKNDDGSTTTTVTDKTTGTVTETTKNTEGSTTVVETKKDGTVTETSKSADGTTGTVVTDSSGEITEVKSSVSSAAVTEAAETGDAVTLPVEVPAAKTTGDAPAVEVTVPKSAGEVKVEIPVEKVTPGTVAVIVHADGTEEIVKTSVVTETGVVLTLDGSATVKIVDNAKVFEDIHSVSHWAEDAVDFVVARGMFAGTSETTFSPNSHMTRAMLMTVLARLDGVDTSGGSVWYEKGMEWAKANGVSDGSNPDAPITREQLATMLWRYAGSPESSHSLDGYTDADEISGYALEAMRWANENGIINGYGNGLLGVKDNATRAQVAQMLMNFVKCLSQ